MCEAEVMQGDVVGVAKVSYQEPRVSFFFFQEVLELS